MDPRSEEAGYGYSPYVSMNNNPISNTDPNGDLPILGFAALYGSIAANILPSVTIAASATAAAATGATLSSGVLAQAGVSAAAVGLSSLQSIPSLPLGSASPNYQNYTFFDQSYDYRRNILSLDQFEPGTNNVVFRTDIGLSLIHI